MTPYKKHAILLICHSRPMHMSKVLSEIEKHYPENLYIFIDNVSKKVSQEVATNHKKVVKLAKSFSGAKHIKIKVPTSNLGCGFGPYSAIDWVLSQEEEVIVLEDDVLPVSDFFHYMDKNLEKFRHSDCMMISSNKYDRFPQFGKSIKTRFTFTNGWATWKRSWSCYDYRLNGYKVNEMIDNNLTFIANKPIWRNLSTKVMSGEDITFWDYQWQFAVWKNNGWSLQPPRNLTKNIGFDDQGTHTKNGDWRESITAEDNGALIKSGFVEIGALHNFIISIYKGYLPSYIYRIFKFKI